MNWNIEEKSEKGLKKIEEKWVEIIDEKIGKNEEKSGEQVQKSKKIRIDKSKKNQNNGIKTQRKIGQDKGWKSKKKIERIDWKIEKNCKKRREKVKFQRIKLIDQNIWGQLPPLLTPF